MRATLAIVATVLLAAPMAAAQDSYRAEGLDEGPPEALSAPIREALATSGTRVLGPSGEPYVDCWLRQAVPAESEPVPPANSILMPYLRPGTLVGAIRLGEEIGDYKDQPILPGLYTMRYGLQPVNGDHLGVSTYRDYFLLSMAEEDLELEPVSTEDLEFLSTGPSGTTHPTVYLLLPAPEGAEAGTVVSDPGHDREGLVLALPITPAGSSEPTTVRMQLVIVGAGPH